MAEQIPFSIAGEILTKLGSLAVQEIELACGVREELKKLGDTLTTIKAVLLDAEERQEREHAVENWARRFKDAIYDADDLLDDFATYELRRGGMARQVSGFFSSSNQVAFHFRMGHRIKDIRGRLDDIANDISKFNFIPRATTSMRVGNTGRETHSFVLMSEIIGRDEDKETIIEKLLQSNNENLSVVAIVGIGGLGKTTLAQLVYNDEKVENHFKPRLWVCVSDNFDVKILVRNIIKSATDRDVENLELDQLKNKLHEELTQKRYLLVLDDVWNEDFEKWDQLRTLLKVGARGSKVVVTTRNPKVASTMGIDSPYVLEGLNEEKHVDSIMDGSRLHPLDENEHLEDVGDQYFKELLSWSMFQDVKIDDNNNIINCKMHDLIHDLAQFIVKSEIFILTNDTNDVKTIPERIYHVSILGWIQGMKVSKGKSIRTLFIASNSDDDPCANSMVNTLLLNCKCLRALSLDAVGAQLTELPKSLIKLRRLRRRLRYLYLSRVGFEVLPSGITSLQNLQTLKLSYCPLIELPRNIRKMINLRHLEIHGCLGLKYMPCRLGELKTLRLTFLYALEYMFKNSSSAEPFPSLKTLELHELRYFKGWWRERGEQAPSFPSLSQLLITYCSQLTTVQLPSCPSLSQLLIRNCSLLTTVQLPSCPLSKFEILECNQLTTVQLHSSPTKLVINDCRSFKSLQLPSCSSSLSELEISFCNQSTTFELISCPLSTLEIRPTVQLSSCPLYQLLIRHCDRLTTFQQLPSCPSLSTLEIRWCDQLTTVQLLSSPTKLVINDCRSFKSLQLPSCSSSLSELKILNCHQLTTLELPWCPSLSELEISWCYQLTTFQLLSSPHLSKLVIRGCRSLECLQLPSCPSLSELQNIRCDQLTTVQLQLPPSLPCLEELKLVGVREEILWQIILVSSSLKSLHIGKIYDLVSLPDDLFEGIQHVTTLETLSITFCDDFTTLPDWISTLTSLSKLEIRGCPRFKLEDRSKIAHIREIGIY
uniref:Disease resistance protein RGA3 n=1 Tax=Vitis vinifera TaxID=29760 RepID=A5BB75_VITVI|nr:hypothetical protein VITISV_002581 [Vitis vinifera]